MHKYTASMIITSCNVASQMMTYEASTIHDWRVVEPDDEHWQCFLLLWDICSVASAFEVTEDDATHLAWLVEVYLDAFQSLMILHLNQRCTT